MFEFYLNNIQVYPLFDGRSANFEQAKPDGQVFFRENFQANFFFQNDAYTTIKNASKGTEFELRIEDLEENKTRLYTFHKSDCTINPSRQYIKVQPQPKDPYKAILDGLNEEIDISKLQIPYTEFKYRSGAVVQIYFAGSEKIINYTQNQTWTTEIENPTDDHNTLYSYWFDKAFEFYYLSGVGHFDSLPSPYPNIAGKYNTSLFHENGQFRIRYNHSLQEWEIVDFDADPTVYTVYFSSSSTDSTNPTLSVYFNSSISASTELRHFNVYTRIVTDESSVTGLTISAMPSNDFVNSRIVRKYVSAYSVPVDNFIFTENVSNTYNNLPNFRVNTNPSLANSTYKYYEVQIGATALIENEWSNLAIWFKPTTAFQTILDNANAKIEVRKGYAFKDFLNAIIQKLDNTLTFDNTCSQFLFNALNPITSVSNFNLIVCPKIEIINAILKENELKNSYKVKLSEIFTMMEYYFKCKFHIENSKVKIEHVYYFHQGKNYTTYSVAKDLTTFIEERTGLNWSIGQDEHTFIKDDLPSQITYNQPDEVSDDFNGSPIRVLDDYVNKSNKKENSIPRFVTDIDYLLNHNLGNKSNFLLLDVNVNKETFYSDVNGIMRQNGRLALFNLIPDLHIYDLPASNVEINGVQTVANTTQRTLRQNLTLGYQASEDFDPMELVVTELGTGEIESISKNLDNRDIKIVARIED